MPKDEPKISKKRAVKEQQEAVSTTTSSPSETVSDDMGNKVTFEEALRELETVVGTLENGGVPLETSLQMLKRGLELADQCERVLADAELTLEKLVLTDEGELISEGLETE